MNYTIQFSDTVDWKKFNRLPKNDRENILKIIREKLGSEPERFGKPLRFSLRGYRRIRIGEYRILYKIEGQNVKITAIGLRSKIY